jgi:hypothetical protein
MPPRISYEEAEAKVRELAYGDIASIEGFIESGKTTFANQLAASTGATAVHLDDFISDGSEELPYYDRLDYKRLAEAITAARTTDRGALVEGICLQVVLRRLELSPSFGIYVMRVAHTGNWHDGMHLQDYLKGNHRRISEPDRSDYKYHSIHAPHEILDFTYVRFERE